MEKIKQVIRLIFSEIHKNPSLLKEEDFAWIKEVLRYVKEGKRINGWVLIARYKISEQTKKQFNLPSDWKHNVYWQPSTNKFLCTCPGFIFNGDCKHSRKLKIFIEECQKEEKILSKL